MTHTQTLKIFLAKPDPALLSPYFNERVPFDQVNQGLASLNRKYGAVQTVSGPDQLGRWDVVTASGSYQILANFAPDGRISGLRIPSTQINASSLLYIYALFSILNFLFILGCTLSWTQVTLFNWLSIVIPSVVLGTTMLSVALWIHLSSWMRPVLWAGLLSLLLSVLHSIALPHDISSFWKIVPGLVTLLVLAPLLVQAINGRKQPPDTVKLGRVIDGSKVLISQGGSTRALNYHMADRHMQYSVDLVGLTSAGRRKIGFLPTDPSAYAIYGRPVLAPLSGRVMEIQNDCPDLQVPQTDSLFPAGNYIILNCVNLEYGNVYVLLAHLKSSSICVKAGDEIIQGDIVGKVGNSGNSTEPHLHLGVYIEPEQDSLLSGVGVPFLIDSKFPIRGTIF